MKLFFVLVVFGVLLFGCVSYPTVNTEVKVVDKGLGLVYVEKFCDEGIVCYAYEKGTRWGTMSCFDSESLVFEKYCGG